ncbi:MAG: hypothetical protein KA998_03895, partial [Rickettsiaceae bacterium]|nr:hypothetical protein [Rickettsiaceae bacterium]
MSKEILTEADLECESVETEFHKAARNQGYILNGLNHEVWQKIWEFAKQGNEVDDEYNTPFHIALADPNINEKCIDELGNIIIQMRSANKPIKVLENNKDKDKDKDKDTILDVMAKNQGLNKVPNRNLEFFINKLPPDFNLCKAKAVRTAIEYGNDNFATLLLDSRMPGEDYEGLL